MVDVIPLATLQRQLMASLKSNSLEDCTSLLSGEYDKLTRLGVYYNNVKGGKANALSNAYPVCFQILGEACFNAVASEFAEENQSIHHDLNLFGANFFQHLADLVEKHEAFSHFPYLPDLALFEWAYHTAYYAEQKVSTNGSNTSELPACFAHYSVALMTSTFPINVIWQNNRDGEGEQAISVDADHYYFAIYRQQFWPKVVPLCAKEYEFMQACVDGISLEALVDRFGDKVTELVPQFLQNGMLLIEQ